VELTVQKIDSSVSVLENSGYLKAGNDTKVHSARIIYSRDGIRSFISQSSGIEIKDILLLLLRTAGERIFDQKVKLNLNDLAGMSGWPEKKIIQLLKSASDSRIIELEEPTNHKKVFLQNERVKPETLSLNVRNLEQLRENAINKLKTMSDFVYYDECRFKYILDYFGEDSEGYECGNCDSCRGESKIASTSNSYIEEIVIRTLHDLKGSIKSTDLVKLLLGNSRHPGMISNPNFGIIA
jgi:ATP-dependent DNA helicase RecQ